MLSIFYNFLLFLIGIIALPRLFWLRVRHGKYKNSLRARLGLTLPEARGDKTTIWIHAVSVGETRAVSSLYHALRKKFPRASFQISSVTETGHAEAMRALPGAENYFYLPLDFSFLIRRIVRRIEPDLFLLVEGEFWYNLLKEVKAAGGKIALVNGKLSERSFKRFLWIKPFARKLFSNIDLFCLQDVRFQERFMKLGVPNERIRVTGNLKLDLAAPFINQQEKANFKQELGIREGEQVIVIGSTHAPEEKELFSVLKPLLDKLPTLKLIFVPRHPERFAKVAHEMREEGQSVLLYSERAKKRGDERLILIDAMGLLTRCYQIADLAIVGGSFVSHVGGHNIFEPIQVGLPVLFGPHMHGQQDLVELVLERRCGAQVTLEQLPEIVLGLLLFKSNKWQEMHNNCLRAASEVQGSTQRTMKIIELDLKNKHREHRDEE
ncbi:MAG: 3-deoxy-D-manno-octulosonic acid transferase [Chlamydiales bacterium]